MSIRCISVFVCCFLVSSLGAQAQTYTTLKTTSTQAAKAFKTGQMAQQEGDAAAAIRSYKKALEADPLLIDAHVALAGTHFESAHWPEAEAAFEKVLQLAPAYNPAGCLYRLAQTEWEQDKFTECAQHAADFLATQPEQERDRRKMTLLEKNARFAAKAVLNPVPFNPQPIGNGINSRVDEYLPVLTADGQTVIFTRRDDGYNENFYQSKRGNDGWETATPISDINTTLNEGAEAISPDGTWLVFTACNRRDDNSQGNCDLYWSQLKNGTWSKAVPFSATINSTDWDAQPSISADGKQIIFSSERPGGQGGRDLWVVNRLTGGKWSTPQNLGSVINTPGNEQTPFLHPDGQTLYFTSDGLPGMGQEDIYFSRRQPDGTWGTPENLGYPINTKDHEGTLSLSLDGRTAYFAAKRPGGVGGLDIYTFEMPLAARPRPVTYAKALVVDGATGYPLAGAKVEFTDLAKGQSFVTATTRPDGSFLVCLPAGADYALAVSKRKYLFHSEHFHLVDSASFDHPYLLNIELIPLPHDSLSADETKSALPIGRPVAMRNVFFDSDAATLKPESATELDLLVKLLEENPTLRVQINGHTDNVGDDASNLRLSERRAQVVQEYLINKGVTAARLRAKGFGETKPLATNDSAKGRAINRRTEFELW